MVRGLMTVVDFKARWLVAQLTTSWRRSIRSIARAQGKCRTRAAFQSLDIATGQISYLKMRDGEAGRSDQSQRWIGPELASGFRRYQGHKELGVGCILALMTIKLGSDAQDYIVRPFILYRLPNEQVVTCVTGSGYGVTTRLYAPATV